MKKNIRLQWKEVTFQKFKTKRYNLNSRKTRYKITRKNTKEDYVKYINVKFTFLYTTCYRLTNTINGKSLLSITVFFKTTTKTVIHLVFRRIPKKRLKSSFLSG